MPDSLVGGGAGDAKADANATDTTKPPTPAPPDFTPVTQVAGAVRDLAEEIRRDRAARAVPARPDPAAQQRALEEEGTRFAKDYDDLCKAGEFSKAAQLAFSYMGRASQVGAPPPEDTPIVKASIATARREARRSHEDTFQHYAPEVEAEINSMPLADRINPDMWDEAVRRVRSRHEEDIYTRRREAEDKKREREAALQAPTAGGGRSPQGATDEEVDSETLAWGRTMGLTDDETRVAAKATEANRITSKDKGMIGLTLLVSDKCPEPGRY